MNKTIPFFSKGEWIAVQIPHHFRGAMAMAYGAAWVRAKEMDMDTHTCSIVAEAIVYQRMYPGLVHAEHVQMMMQKVMK